MNKKVNQDKIKELKAMKESDMNPEQMAQFYSAQANRYHVLQARFSVMAQQLMLLKELKEMNAERAISSSADEEIEKCINSIQNKVLKTDV